MSEFISKLIASMNQGEKRLFVLSLANSKRKDLFLKLFKVYSSSKVGQQLSDTLNNLSKKEQADLKSRLTQKLISFLNNQFLKQQKPAKTTVLITNAKMLMHRGFWTEAYKQLNKAEKIAAQYEQFTELFEINHLKILYNRHYKPTDAPAKELLNIHFKWKKQLEDYHEFVQSNTKTDSVYIRVYGTENDKLLLNQSLKFQYTPMGKKIKSIDLAKKILDYKRLNEHQKRNETEFIAFDFMLENPILVESDPRLFLAIIYNVSISLVVLDRTEEIPGHLKHYERLKSSGNNIYTDSQLFKYASKFIYLLNSRKKIDPTADALDFLKFRNKYHKNHITIHSFLFSNCYVFICFTYFKNKNWETCWDWYNKMKVENLTNESLYTLVESALELALLICFIELEQEMLIESRQQKVARTILKKHHRHNNSKVKDYFQCVKLYLKQDWPAFKKSVSSLETNPRMAVNKLLVKWLVEKANSN